MNREQVATKPAGPTGKARVVVVENVYHQASTGEIVLTEGRFSRLLKSDEQPYGPRRLTLGGTWTPLDVGWVKEVGFVILRNESKDTGVDVGVWVGETTQALITLAPGESLRFQPTDASAWCLRSQGEAARCVLTVLPQ